MVVKAKSTLTNEDWADAEKLRRAGKKSLKKKIPLSKETLQLIARLRSRVGYESMFEMIDTLKQREEEKETV